MNLEPFLTAGVKNLLAKEFDRAGIKEACGLIRFDGSNYSVEPCDNVATNPEQTFELTTSDSLTALDSSVVAVYHTHPKGELSPSKSDLKSQALYKKPFVICTRSPDSGVMRIFSFGDHLLDYPLYSRAWHYGVFDCLEALRSWYHQMLGIYLPPAPRTDFWWILERQSEVEDEDKDAYVRNIDAWGFAEYVPNLSDPTSRFHPKPGDVLLMQTGSIYANHSAVYIGNNMVFHHRYNHLSCDSPIGYLIQGDVIRKWCRHRSMM